VRISNLQERIRLKSFESFNATVLMREMHDSCRLGRADEPVSNSTNEGVSNAR